MEFPLSLTDTEHRGGDTRKACPVEFPHPDACPVEFPLSLTDSERHPDACPVEFPLSLTDTEHRCGVPP